MFITKNCVSALSTDHANDVFLPLLVELPSVLREEHETKMAAPCLPKSVQRGHSGA